MDVSTLEKRLLAVGERRPSNDAESLDDDEISEGRCYGVRGQRHNVRSLELRWVSGRVLCLDWAWLPDVLWQDGTIVLMFSSRGFAVTITGRNLRTLSNRLGMRSVAWVQQMLEMHDSGDAKSECVFGIHVRALGEGEELALLIAH